MRLARITWRPLVALWIQRWLYAELCAKGAQVAVGQYEWVVRWSR
jgi:hypothetical protein